MSTKWKLAAAAAVILTVGVMITLFVSLRSLLFSGPYGFRSMDVLQAQQAKDARVALARAKTDPEKCYPLARIAKDDFNRGKLDEARTYANELVRISTILEDKGKGPYGVAVHDGNMILGRIALREHDKQSAKQYLLKSGLTVGAATLDSFGPNMSLAKDLLEAGEQSTVIEYFHECHRFWSYKSDLLNSWERTVRDGGMPNFGANLYY